MINNIFENICLEDSYLLGWNRSVGTLAFNVELLLTANHNMFEPYDKKEYGCYKVGQIIFSGYDTVEGLQCDNQPMKQDNSTSEYVDIADIDEISELDLTAKIYRLL